MFFNLADLFAFAFFFPASCFFQSVFLSVNYTVGLLRNILTQSSELLPSIYC